MHVRALPLVKACKPVNPFELSKDLTTSALLLFLPMAASAAGEGGLPRVRGDAGAADERGEGVRCGGGATGRRRRPQPHAGRSGPATAARPKRKSAWTRDVEGDSESESSASGREERIGVCAAGKGG